MNRFSLLLFSIIIISCNSYSKRVEAAKRRMALKDLHSEARYAKFTNNSEIDVVNLEKAFDSSSIHFKDSEESCVGWELDKKKIETILTTSEKIDGHEWHYFYLDLPCYYSGMILIDGKVAFYHINAGAVSHISFRDTTVTLGYKKDDFRNYFIAGKTVYQD